MQPRLEKFEVSVEILTAKKAIVRQLPTITTVRVSDVEHGYVKFVGWFQAGLVGGPLMEDRVLMIDTDGQPVLLAPPYSRRKGTYLVVIKELIPHLILT